MILNDVVVIHGVDLAMEEGVEFLVIRCFLVGRFLGVMFSMGVFVRGVCCVFCNHLGLLDGFLGRGTGVFTGSLLLVGGRSLVGVGFVPGCMLVGLENLLRFRILLLLDSGTVAIMLGMCNIQAWTEFNPGVVDGRGAGVLGLTVVAVDEHSGVSTLDGFDCFLWVGDAQDFNR